MLMWSCGKFKSNKNYLHNKELKIQKLKKDSKLLIAFKKLQCIKSNRVFKIKQVIFLFHYQGPLECKNCSKLQMKHIYM